MTSRPRRSRVESQFARIAFASLLLDGSDNVEEHKSAHQTRFPLAYALGYVASVARRLLDQP